MALPKDGAILLSYLNTMLRDRGVSLEELCGELGEEPNAAKAALLAEGYVYDREQRRFVPEG